MKIEAAQKMNKKEAREKEKFEKERKMNEIKEEIGRVRES